MGILPSIVPSLWIGVGVCPPIGVQLNPPIQSKLAMPNQECEVLGQRRGPPGPRAAVALWKSRCGRTKKNFLWVNLSRAMSIPRPPLSFYTAHHTTTAQPPPPTPPPPAPH